ncbi:hypothetical protein GCM10009733_019290 [Nonomuraea maheshkhaliensis]|uniref:Uncharacterized protein n=1 Tax=Nonomuraea maheshkhaliensis TaxID=419590 RepID=A0ABP4QU11_9ACTN
MTGIAYQRIMASNTLSSSTLTSTGCAVPARRVSQPSRADLARLTQVVACETAFALLHSFTAYDRDHEAPADTPGRRLMQTTPSGELTGRALQSLHESLLTMNPSGRDGQDPFS